MDYLMAKTKGRGTGDFIVMTSESPFFQTPKVANSLAYNDEYKLQDNEWFVLDFFSRKNYCWELLKKPFDASAYSNLPRDYYPTISYMYVVQDGTFFFQKITNCKVLQKKVVSFSLNNEPECINMAYAIIIDMIPDAMYVVPEDKLYFRKLSDVTNIFVGIDELYKEATDEETSSFLNIEILNVCTDLTADKVKTANRRRIKAAMDRYNNFSVSQKVNLIEYLKKYNTKLRYDEGMNKFMVSSDAELTDLLNGINQRYYTAEIDGEQRLANSVTILQ